MSLSFEKSSFCYLPPKRIGNTEASVIIKHSESLQINTVFPEKCNVNARSNLQMGRREVLHFGKEKDDLTIIVHKVERVSQDKPIRINPFFSPL